MKLIKNDGIKRLILFFMYDKDGIIDDYIVYMLEQLNKVSSDIYVVCNGKLCDEGRGKLQTCVNDDHIIVRENKGFDVWAYKTGIDTLGWDKVCSYDEMIMMNFTIMGPVYPIEEMFDKMNSEDVDFWGITKFTGYEDGDPFGTISYGYIPEHIQSHFIAVRKPMLEDDNFKEYFDNMPAVHNYKEAVGFHEAIFTKKFSDLGFKWDVYAKLDDDFSRNPVINASKELIADARCPFFKRRSFMQDYENVLDETIGQSTLEMYDYIRDYTDYDINYIWDNILRLENQAVVKRNMHFNYVLPREFSANVDDVLQKRKIALIMHIYYEDQAEVCLNYAKAMPESTDVYITTDNEKKLEHIKEVFKDLKCNKLVIKLRENKGRDLSTLIVSFRKEALEYDYVCYMHDKKVKQLHPQTMGYGFAYKCFENILASKDFVKNVIYTFEKNERLGLMAPPPPNHGCYYFILGQEWGKNYKNTAKLVDELGLSVNIKEEFEPISALGSMFWFRPKALKKELEYDWKFEQFPDEPVDDDGTILHAIERIHGYVCQDAGYYPAFVMSSRGAAMELTNLEFMVKTLNKILFQKGCAGGSFIEVCNNLNRALNNDIIPPSCDTKLYIDMNSEGLSEKHSIEVSKDPVKKCFIYDISETFEEEEYVDLIRWDPCENGNIAVNEFKADIYTEQGLYKTFGFDDVITNGFKTGNVIYFLANDPQMTIDLKEKIKITQVVIHSNIIPRIDDQSFKNMTDMLNNRSMLKRVKHKITNK